MTSVTGAMDGAEAVQEPNTESPARDSQPVAAVGARPRASGRVARKPRADASDRILRGAARTIVATGAVDLTMNDVAEEAEVSKGLIHYHFHDKETLLARVVEWITRNLVVRQRAALAQSTHRSAIDDLWAWLAAEIELGHIRVLIELAEWRGELVRRAMQESMRERRLAAAETVETLYALLGLKPRIDADLIAGTLVAFNNGLAVSAALEPEGNPRVAFDVFWLSLLGLAE
jgi:AcrR family transcriptional regulator